MINKLGTVPVGGARTVQITQTMGVIYVWIRGKNIDINLTFISMKIKKILGVKRLNLQTISLFFRSVTAGRLNGKEVKWESGVNSSIQF